MIQKSGVVTVTFGAIFAILGYILYTQNVIDGYLKLIGSMFLAVGIIALVVGLLSVSGIGQTRKIE